MAHTWIEAGLGFGCVWAVFPEGGLCLLCGLCGSPAAFATPADMETASLYTMHSFVADISTRFPSPPNQWWFVSGCIRESVLAAKRLPSLGMGSEAVQDS